MLKGGKLTRCSEDSELLDLLTKLYPDSSKSTLRSWIGEGRVFIDGKQVKSAKFLIKKGQELTLGQKIRKIENQIPVLYSDNEIIVIDKPVGLLSVSTAFEKEETAHAILKRKYYPRPVYVVHRLDQETSGAMVFALSERSLNALKILFEKHDLERRYIAIVEGKLSQDKGTWQTYLYEDPNYFVRVVSNPSQGELAITHFEVKASNKLYSWLELTLETGKKNQIRVHCQHAGNPVVGDRKYGAESNPMRRLGLHAYCLAFSHPITKKKMRFLSPIPEIFYSVVKPKEI